MNAETSAKFYEMVNTFDRLDVDLGWKILKERYTRLQNDATRFLRVGTRVQWTSRYGDAKTGVVEKVNTKTVRVKLPDGKIWIVSPTLLTIV
jgi:hypothetical protein